MQIYAPILREQPTKKKSKMKLVLLLATERGPNEVEVPVLFPY